MQTEKKQRAAWKTALIAALVVLLLGGAAAAGWLLGGAKDRDDDEAEDPRIESREEKPEETDSAEPAASAEPTEAPVPVRVQLLEQMGYIGDRDACTMTSAQALACADKIRAAQGGVVMAALFDGGSGVPILWIAQADSMRAESDNTTALTGHYQDKLYGFQSGQLDEYTWMTTLLRAGTDGVMVKLSRDSTRVQFFHLNSGAFEKEPFGVGAWDHSGDATYNGVSIGAGSEVALWDFYRAAGSDLKVLLEAMSGDSENLYLTGPWLSGAEMSGLLERYAASVA